MEPIEISPRPEPPPYEVTMLPGARPQFHVGPLWTKTAGAPEIAVDSEGEPLLLLTAQSFKGSPQVIIKIPLTVRDRALLVYLLQQEVRVDEIRAR
jgi:hypothetical protein